MHTPTRTHEQRLAALAEGNRIRSYRKAIKAKLTAGEVTILDLRDDPDMQSARVLDFLLAEPQVGVVKANQLIRHARISPSKTFRGLTDRQWLALGDAFRATSTWAKLHPTTTIERQAA